MSQSVSPKKVFFWNIMGSLSTAAISVLLLMVVTHILSIEQADLYSFAYALSNLMIMIGLFQVRNFQSTDMSKVYRFEDYLLTRLMTSFFMLCAVVIYLCGMSFDTFKTELIFYTCLYRLTDSISDVYQGFYQQNQRLDLAGKYLFVRNSVIFIVFLSILLVTKNLLLGLQLVCLVSALVILLTEVRYSIHVETWKMTTIFTKKSLDNGLSLLLQTLPLFINGFLLMYTYNKPKYVLDELTSLGSVVAGEQTVFNILLMPAFVMNLLILFFRPIITEIALCIAKGDNSKLIQSLRKLFVYLGVSTFIIMLGSCLVGLPLLSLLYSIDVTDYLMPFIFIMLGGAFSSFAAAVDNIITAMRKQKLLIIPYFGAFLASQLVTSYLISNYHMFGAALSFNIAMFIWLVLSYFVYRIVLN